MSFWDNMNSINKNITFTENGASGYRTTGKALLDLSWKLSSYRGANNYSAAAQDFMNAMAENEELAFKFLFFARDILEGAGERQFFRTIVKSLALKNLFPNHLISLIPEYGRWDDLFAFFNTPSEEEAIRVIKTQLLEDMENAKNNKSISLCAKWMPSIQTNNCEKYIVAKKLRLACGLSERQYRKMLSKLRGNLDLVETNMSENKWNKIKYENVPSAANIKYRSAFIRHDAARRTAFLNDVINGERKINAKVLAPHEIVSAYYKNRDGWYSPYKVDNTLEALWDSLPTNFSMDNSTIVVADGSGSMCSRVGNTNTTALDIANALAIYFGERCHGEYKNRYITFSATPRFVDFNKATTLADKLNIAIKHDEIANTNIQRVFELILSTAIKHPESTIPSNILIISDMEFDRGAERYGQSLFDRLVEKFESNGFKMPHLIFWNVCSRSCAIPMQENSLGVTLISGFSPNLMKMVMSGELNAYKALVATLNSERYAKIKVREI